LDPNQQRIVLWEPEADFLQLADLAQPPESRVRLHHPDPAMQPRAGAFSPDGMF
jgi:hypothetical protein